MKLTSAKMRKPPVQLDKKTFLKDEEGNINIFTENRKGEFYFISLEQLVPFKKQSRRYFNQESIDTLALTIKEHGIRQPLTIVKSEEENKFEIVSGERRYLAAKKNGMEKVPCIIIHDYKKAEEIALIENIQRENLNPIELGIAYKALYESQGYPTQLDVAEKVGVSRSQVSEYMKLAELDSRVIDLLVKHDLMERKYLRTVSGLDSTAEMLTFIQKTLEGKKKDKKGAPRDANRKSTLVTVFLKGSNLEKKSINLAKLHPEEKEKLKILLTRVIEELE